MKTRPTLTVNQWLASVPAERKDAIHAVRDIVNEHLPRGYEETEEELEDEENKALTRSNSRPVHSASLRGAGTQPQRVMRPRKAVTRELVAYHSWP